MLKNVIGKIWAKGNASGGNDVVRKAGAKLSRKQRWWVKMRLNYDRLLPWVSVVLLGVVIVVPLALFVWWIFFTDVFTVQAVTVVDARDHTSQATEEVVMMSLAKVPLSKNIFFVPVESIELEILTELPQVKTVHVTRKLPGTVKVILQEKEPSLLLLSGGRYYFVDDTGVPYEEASLDTLPGVVLPIVKNDDKEARVTIGAGAVEPGFVAFVTQVQAKLPEQVASEVVEIHIPSLAAREVHMVLNNNWRILFDVTRSSTNQLDILAGLLRETISAEEMTSLEYIDLRIPNRVYYKAGL